MPLEDSGSFPYPSELTTFEQVREYLVRLREAMVTHSLQLAENVETRLAQQNYPTISGTPANNQVATWSSATEIGPESTLVYDGNILNVNDTTNAKMTQGLNLNQGANDDEILSLKSSDVACGVTDLTETDTYGRLKKVSATEGGIQIDGFSEATISAQIGGVCVTDNTTQGLTGRAVIETLALKKSGTGYTFPASGANIFAVRAYIYTSTTASLLLVDIDGNLWTAGYILPVGGYKSSDGTAGATDADVDTAATPHLVFKDGLFISAGT